MAEPIKPGDLVMLIRTHCSASEARFGGLIDTVAEMAAAHPSYAFCCRQCGGIFGHGWKPARLGSANGWVPVQWLKKFDPPAEPERVERPEEVTA